MRPGSIHQLVVDDAAAEGLARTAELDALFAEPLISVVEIFDHYHERPLSTGVTLFVPPNLYLPEPGPIFLDNARSCSVVRGTTWLHHYMSVIMNVMAAAVDGTPRETLGHLDEWLMSDGFLVTPRFISGTLSREAEPDIYFPPIAADLHANAVLAIPADRSWVLVCDGFFTLGNETVDPRDQGGDQ